MSEHIRRMLDDETREDQGRVCRRCKLLFEMARDPDRPWSIQLPPHHPRCPEIAHKRPRPLSEVG